MPPFNKRQVGYIKAVAGVGQHKSFQHYSNQQFREIAGTKVTNPTQLAAIIDATKNTDGEYTTVTKFVGQPSLGLTQINHNNLKLENFNADSEVGQDNTDSNKQLGAAVFCLNNIPLTVDHNDTSTNFKDHVLQQSKFDKLGCTINKMMLLYQGYVHEGSEENTTAVSTGWRVGSDYYVESTHLKWRFTMPDFTVSSGKQPHHEYRFIAFRQRKPTYQREGNNSDTSARQALNWNYDLFNGYNGRPVGWSGYRQREQFDGSGLYIEGPLEYRVGNVAVSQQLNTDDLMTLPVNDADYVVMRDERFFLGAEHGKSHYETVTRFDWSDPGSINSNQMDQGMDDGKNYDWWFIILGTTNDGTAPKLNIHVRGTTAITSA